MTLLLLIASAWVLVAAFVVAICRAAACGDDARPPHWNGPLLAEPGRDSVPGIARRRAA